MWRLCYQIQNLCFGRAFGIDTENAVIHNANEISRDNESRQKHRLKRIVVETFLVYPRLNRFRQYFG